MKQIKLVNQQIFALVDDEDFEILSRHPWYLLKPKGGYLYTHTKLNDSFVTMHQMILPTGKGLTVDHKNGNGLDNRKENLRIATKSQNSANSKKQNSVFKYKGTWRTPSTGKWTAYITVNKKRIHLGSYVTEIEAAKAYNRAALYYFKEFARVNEIEEVRPN